MTADDDEWQATFIARVAEYRRKKAEQAQVRADLAQRRRHGVAQRNAQRLARARADQRLTEANTNGIHDSWHEESEVDPGGSDF